MQQLPQTQSFNNMRYTQLVLDTKLFGFKVAKILTSRLTPKKLKLLLEYFCSLQIHLVYWQAMSNDKNSQLAARQCGGFLSSKQVTYICKLSKNFSEIQNDIPVTIYRGRKPTASMYQLSLQVGERSRFGIDPQFTPRLWHKMYRTWIINAVNGTAAKKVFVAKYRNKIVGMLTLGINKREGRIILIAVDEKMRGQSIGKKLVYTALNYCRRQRCTQVHVVTQLSNLDGCRLYVSCGFKKSSMGNFYHFWL